jgi:hypothetical protein
MCLIQKPRKAFCYSLDWLASSRPIRALLIGFEGLFIRGSEDLAIWLKVTCPELTLSAASF